MPTYGSSQKRTISSKRLSLSSVCHLRSLIRLHNNVVLVRLRTVVRLLSAVAVCTCSLAQESGVPVVIDGREVLRVYGSVGPFTVTDRASEIQRRIVALAKK